MSKQIAPIKPQDVAARQNSAIPSEVIEVFNDLIAKNYKGGSARVNQDEALKELVKKGLKRGEIFEKGWLDVEDLFEKSGWEVEYDKPGYNESYEAFFIFKAR